MKIRAVIEMDVNGPEPEAIAQAILASVPELVGQYRDRLDGYAVASVDGQG
jgi:hypothetical protein